MRRTYAILMAVGLLTGLLTATGAPASATETFEGPSLHIPVGTVVRGPSGSMHELGSTPVAPELQGQECVVTSTATNQNSVHPGNDIVVSSNGTSVTLKDVEREGFVETTANGMLTLGVTMSATLQMGDDEVFSGGIDVTTECYVPEPDPIGDTLTKCDPVTGWTRVTASNPGEVAFEATLTVNGEVAVHEELAHGASTYYTYYPDEKWGFLLNGELLASGVAEDCLEVPETTTTTTPEVPKTTTTTMTPTTSTIPEVETDIPDEESSSAGWYALGVTLVVTGLFWRLKKRADRLNQLES